MNACNTVELRNGNKYIKTTCAYCKKEIWRQKYNAKKHKVFCKRPAYCSYAYKLKERDPKGGAILEHINDSNFIYLIGLICTDGNINYHTTPVSGKSYYCNITLYKTDINVIEKIKNKFGGTIFKAKDNTIRWILSYKFFVEYLINIGITQNKSKTLNVSNWFNTLKKTDKLHFLRGVIDGDGSIKIYKNNYRTFNICCGSTPFFNMIKNFLLEEFTNINLKEQHYPTYSYLQLNGRYMLPLLNEIYKDIEQTNLIYIERKYKEYSKIKDHFNEFI